MSDMDGVLVHEGKLIPGADTFVERLQRAGTPFLVLTNNSIYTPRDLRFRLLNTGLDIPVESIWTSALATAAFLGDQRPEGSAFVIGEAGLTTARKTDDVRRPPGTIRPRCPLLQSSGHDPGAKEWELKWVRS